MPPRRKTIEAEDRDRGLPVSPDVESAAPDNERGAEAPPTRHYIKRDPQESDVTQLFPLAGVDDVVILYRRNETTLEYDLVKRHPGSVTIDEVQDDTGGGVYRAVLRGLLRVTGKKGRLGQRDFVIEGARRNAGAEDRDEGGAELGAAPGTPTSSARAQQLYDAALLGLFEQMQNNNKMTIAMISRMMSSMDKGPSFADIAALIQASRGGAAGDPLELAFKLAEAMGNGGANRNPPTETKSALSALKDVMEIKEMLKGDNDGDGGGKPGGVIDILREFAPQIVEAVKGARAIDARRAAAAPATIPEVGTVDIIAQFGPAIPSLVNAASNNEDAAGVAVNILAQAGPLVGPLTDALAQPTFTDTLLAAYPQIAPWRPWVENVVAELRQRRGLGPQLVKPRATL